jgi:hypothetical protein
LSVNQSQPRKTIDRSTLVKLAGVLDLLSNEDCVSGTVGEMRKLAFEKLPREDIPKVIDYCESPSDYLINEDVETE